MADIEKKILLDIQTTAVKNLAEAQTAIQNLRKEIKEQSKDYANNSQSIAENQLKIKQLQGVVSEQTKIAMNANAQINGNVGAYKALSLQYAVSAQRAKDLSAEFGVNSAQAKKAQLEANGLNDKLKAIDKTVGQNQRSVGDYGIALKGLPDVFGELASSATETFSSLKDSIDSAKGVLDDYKDAILAQKEAQEIAKASQEALLIAEQAATAAKLAQIEAEQAQIIAEAELATATATGTATEEMQTAVVIANTTAMEAGVVASEATATAEIARATATSTATTATMAGANAMKILKIAIANTGIGLIVIAVLLLVDAFRKFTPVVDKVEQIFSALGAGMEVVYNLIIEVATGAKSLGEAFGSLGGDMSKATKEAMKLTKAQQDLEDQMDANDVLNKKTETQIQKLILQSKNRTLSEKERMDLIDKAQKLDEEVFQRNKKISDESIRIAENEIINKLRLSKADQQRLRTEGVEYAKQLQDKKRLSDEDITKLKDALIKREDITQQSIQLQEKAQNREDALAEKAEEKRQKAIESATKRKEQLLKNDEQMLASKRKIFEEEGKFQIIDPTIVAYRLKQLETFTQQEKLNVIASAKFEKKTKEELTAELQAVDAKLKSDQTALLQKAGQDTIEHNNRLVELEKLKNEEIMAGKRISLEEQLKADTLAIELTKVNAKKELDAKKELGLIGEVEYQDEVAKIDQQAKTDLAKTNAQFIKDENEKEYNAKKANIDRELALSYNTANEEYQLTLQRLELEKQAEIKKAKETGESIDLIEKEYAQKAEQANFDKLQRQTDQYVKYGESIANVFGAFSDLMKANEDAELQKDTEANEAKKANLQERLDKGLIDKKTFDKEVANSEKELDNKKKKIEREQAIRARILSAFGIIASTAQAVIGALAPPPTGLGPVAGIPFAIAAGAVGALQMATLLSAPLPKASRGTLLKGASHANGGIPIEAEGGEAIINKRSTSMFLPVLSAINEAGGGVPFVQTMADGGYVSRNSNQQSVNGSIAEIVRATISEMKIYTTIEDIRREDKKYTNIEASANF
jgi:hypothetical protein